MRRYSRGTLPHSVSIKKLLAPYISLRIHVLPRTSAINDALFERNWSFTGLKQVAPEPMFKAVCVTDYGAQSHELRSDAAPPCANQTCQQQFHDHSAPWVGHELSFIKHDESELIEDVRRSCGQPEKLLVGKKRNVVLAT